MKPSNTRPSAAEFGRLRSLLARRGASPAQVQAWVGAAPAGRTRGEIAGQLRERLRALPRKSEG